MAVATLEVLGTDVLLSVDGAESRFSEDDLLSNLKGWAERYDRATAWNRESDLIALGREMFQALDRDGSLMGWRRQAGDRELRVIVLGDDKPVEAALLDAPWELLADEHGPLAAHPLQLFIVSRRIGRPASPAQPAFRDLQLMFMAAAPDTGSELDFEQEEAAILQATERESRVQLVVEETGALEWLCARLASEEGPFEALHLSCHGDIDSQRGPVLLLEDDGGATAFVTAAELISALPPQRPLLVALSACRTAEIAQSGAGPLAGVRTAVDEPHRAAHPKRESGDSLSPVRAGGTSAPLRHSSPELSGSFARQLVTQVAQVLAWDGSVYDQDAIEFATTFYAELGRGHSVPRAAATARRALWQVKQSDACRGRHWHLARIYLGPQGGGPLCASKQPAHARLVDTERAFLDAQRRVPVASRAAFVGRRRAIQAVLGAFAKGKAALIHGMGALGKSSLAARVANRVQRRPVVIHGRGDFDVRILFDAMLAALAPADRQHWRSEWRDQICADAGRLQDALEALLTGPLDVQPILLILDDLEQILEPPQPSAVPLSVQHEYRGCLRAVLGAFGQVQSRSRLLLTSRYDFQLLDTRGRDLALALARIPLGPMDVHQRRKQWRAAQRLAGKATQLSADATELLFRALQAASGNPGLQDTLTRPLLAGETAIAQRALEQIEHYRRFGSPPQEIAELIAAGAARDDENAMVAFFRRLCFDHYRQALSVEQAQQLAAATHFPEGVPIPLAALAAVGSVLGVAAPEAAIQRLLGLGLYDDQGRLGGHPHAAANALARPLAPAITQDSSTLASAAFPLLEDAWSDASGAFPPDRRGVVAAEQALAGHVAADRLEAAAYAGAVWLARGCDDESAALVLLRDTLSALPVEHEYDPELLRLVLECASGRDGEIADRVQRVSVRPARGPADTAHAALDLRRAERLVSLGQLEQAEALVQSSLRTFRSAQDERMAAITQGQIADILQARGQLDEALRIRTEEELPIYERLGDVRSKALTQGKIADILQARGQLDEALRIRTKDQLPVYERLGDVRSKAITQGKIADILQARGQLDEALRIRTKDQLPIYERLGDVRSKAITQGQIADILQARGELDEALRIRTEEELPIYERLGDVRSKAITQGQIADILQARGELDEALRIRTEDQLPVFERLGDVHSKAITLQQIASTLIASGGMRQGRLQEIYEALAESFAIAQHLKLADGVGFVGLQLAQIMMVGGLREQAIEVLDQAEAALALLRATEAMAHARALRRQIESDEASA